MVLTARASLELCAADGVGRRDGSLHGHGYGDLLAVSASSGIRLIRAQLCELQEGAGPAQPLARMHGRREFVVSRPCRSHRQHVGFLASQDYEVLTPTLDDRCTLSSQSAKLSGSEISDVGVVTGPSSNRLA